ncbi:MAG: T9SS type A sorting domain-containing protein [Flavobacteriales bacterium]|nr:T9SS type A sorting domain-containing protein [Flavobacteriales bacterium]MCB9363164.1 T9SS type A sorting domain-containing protein [Flavobacteriales bacterium]
MKTTLSILFLIILNLSVKAQDFSIQFFVEDNIGRKDTITLGINTSSTLGIDSSLGEVDIYNTPFDSLDIRVIQRDSANHNCIRTDFYSYNSPNLYFPNNIDTKIDFRPFIYTNFYSLNLNFEIFINAVEYPVTVRADYTGLQGHFFDGYSSAFLIDPASCEAVVNSYIYSYSSTGYDSIFTLPNNSWNTFVVHFEHEVGVNELNSSKINIHPNPTTEQQTISLEESKTGTLLIRNSIGQIIHQEKFENTSQFNINLNEPPGIYFLQLETDGQVITRKIIKQ